MKILKIVYDNGTKVFHFCKVGNCYQTTRSKIHGNDGTLEADEEFGIVTHKKKHAALSFLLGHLDNEAEVIFEYNRGISRKIVCGGEIESQDNLSWCNEEPVWVKSDSTKTSKNPVEVVLTELFGSY